MGGRADWGALRVQRMAEPGAQDAYEAARLAFELGRSVRELRVQQGWSQTELAREAGYDPVGGGQVRGRGYGADAAGAGAVSAALGVELAVSFSPRAAAA